MTLNLINYLINRKHTKKYEEIFEAFANGRKKALEHWFDDKWAQVSIIKNELMNLEDDKIKPILSDKLEEYDEFCEIFILDQEANVIVSTCEKHYGLKLNNLQNYIETDDATKSIGYIIMQVQDNTNSTFKCATKMNEKVELSVVNVKDTLDSFDEINKDIFIISKTMKSISQITSTQNDDICELMNNISNAAEELNASTEKNTLESDLSIKLVKEVISEMDNLKQVLEYSSDNLNILVSAFKLS